MNWQRCWLALLWALTLGPAMSLRADEHALSLGGHVSGDGKPLAGVLVSDGRRVVRTDAGGEYRLPVGEDSGRFIFVTLPRGYWSEGFYVPLAEAIQEGEAQFDLTSASKSDQFEFVFIADMHLERREVGGAKLMASLAEINEHGTEAGVSLFQGDICLQSGAGDLYAECCQVAEMPTRHGAGNHEMILAHENPRDEFEQRFGPTYYSFDWGPLHCIVLDGNKPIPGRDGLASRARGGRRQRTEMVESGLGRPAQGKPIVVGVHIPIVSSYPERRSTSSRECSLLGNDESPRAHGSVRGTQGATRLAGPYARERTHDGRMASNTWRRSPSPAVGGKRAWTWKRVSTTALAVTGSSPLTEIGLPTGTNPRPNPAWNSSASFMAFPSR